VRKHPLQCTAVYCQYLLMYTLLQGHSRSCCPAPPAGREAELCGSAVAVAAVRAELWVYHTKVLLDKGIIDKGIIRTKVLLDKGIVRN
jgi:hypothetical protein